MLLKINNTWEPATWQNECANKRLSDRHHCIAAFHAACALRANSPDVGQYTNFDRRSYRTSPLDASMYRPRRSAMHAVRSTPYDRRRTKGQMLISAWSLGTTKTCPDG